MLILQDMYMHGVYADLRFNESLKLDEKKMRKIVEAKKFPLSPLDTLFQGDCEADSTGHLYYKILRLDKQDPASKKFLNYDILKERFSSIFGIQKENLNISDSVDLGQTFQTVFGGVDHSPFIASPTTILHNKFKIFYNFDFFESSSLKNEFFKKRRFSEEEARFLASCLVLAVGHVHKGQGCLGETHIDNIEILKSGYPKLKIFGVESLNPELKLDKTSSNTLLGLSPETLQTARYSQSMDWWGLGVIIYQLLIGIPPFYCKNRVTLMKMIIKNSPLYPDKYKLSPNCLDFIKKVSPFDILLLFQLLTKDPKIRLGSQAGSLEVMSHPWFINTDWVSLMEMKVDAPFKPQIESHLWLTNRKNKKVGIDCKNISKIYLQLLQVSMFLG